MRFYDRKSGEIMTIECKDIYEIFMDKAKENIQVSVTDENLLKMNKSFLVLLDYGRLIDCLSDKPEIVIFQQAQDEYYNALLSLGCGQYRYAFTGLRFFLELTLAGILFSAREIELRTWMVEQRDIFWKEIIDLDNGVFSKKFARAFFESLESESKGICPIAEKIYRECSEYIHGNYIASNKLPRETNFSQEIFDEWHDKVRSITLVVFYAYSVRYLSLMEKDKLGKIQDVICRELNHLPPVRALFGGTIGG